MDKRKTESATSATVGQIAGMAKAYRKRRAKAHAKAAAQAAAEVRRVEGLAVVNEHAAGIDIGSRSHWVCVGVSADQDADVIREFLAYTEGLQEIVAYLAQRSQRAVAANLTRADQFVEAQRQGHQPGHPRHTTRRQRRRRHAAAQLLAAAPTTPVEMHRQLDRQGRTHALRSSLLGPSSSPASVLSPSGWKVMDTLPRAPS